MNFNGANKSDLFFLFRKEVLSLEKLEAQLKACLCRIVFSKAKVSICTRNQRHIWTLCTII